MSRFQPYQLVRHALIDAALTRAVEKALYAGPPSGQSGRQSKDISGFPRIN